MSRKWIGLVALRLDQSAGGFNATGPFIGLIVRGARGHLVGAVLGVDAGKTRERIKANNSSRMIVRLVNTAQVFVERQILSPADAELENHAIHGEEMLIKIVDEQRVGQSLPACE